MNSTCLTLCYALHHFEPLIRSNMRKDLREYNTKMIQTTIENNRSVNKLFRTMAPKKQILSLKEEDGSRVRNRQRIVERTKEFYEELYKSSDPSPSDSRNMDEEINPITSAEVKEAL